MPTAIYYALWVILHTLVAAYNALYLLIVYVTFRAGNVFKTLISSGACDEFQFLDSCRKELSKIPKHLSIIVGTRPVSDELLSKVAFYALISDIDYISYYDVNGGFTLESVEIPKYVETRKMPNGRFLWSMSTSRRKAAGQLRYKNGLDKSIEVVVLSPHDSRPLLADVSREVWTKRSDPHVAETIDSKNSLANCITSSLDKRLGNLPEPDLAIIFDSTMITYGLLPWHTRFTEFHIIRNTDCFDVSTFARVLFKYSKCEQRFGK